MTNRPICVPVNKHKPKPARTGTSTGWRPGLPSMGFDAQVQLVGLFDILVDVIFCAKDLDYRYTEVNVAFVRRTGRTSKRDVVGKRATELFKANMAQRYEEQDKKVFSTGAALRDELELIRREDGSLGWYSTTKLPVPDDDGGVVGLVSVSRDLHVAAVPGTPTQSNDVMESMSRVAAHIRTNVSRRIKVAELAEVAQCSKSQLERRMRKTFGVPATKYIMRCRVDRAADLLTGTDMALAEIATAAGFYDQADFTFRFAQLTSETPAQFRNQWR